MINTIFFKYKTFGSVALRCGCSHFGARTFSGKLVSSDSSGGFPTQLVFVFKNYHKAQNFKGWLMSFLVPYSDYYGKEIYKNGQMLHLVFVNCGLFIKGGKPKLYYKTFRSFCRASLTLYKSGTVHPNKSSSNFRRVS